MIHECNLRDSNPKLFVALDGIIKEKAFPIEELLERHIRSTYSSSISRGVTFSIKFLNIRIVLVLLWKAKYVCDSINSMIKHLVSINSMI